jgi:hypothetical protein
VSSRDRIARFPGNKAGFAMESQSRRAYCISMAWELVSSAHVSGRDRMRFDSDRLVAWEAIGHPAATSDSLHQHDWRSSKRSRAARLSITARPADRGSNDILSGPLYDRTQNSLNATPPADFRAHDAVRAPSRPIRSEIFPRDGCKLDR